MKSLKGKVITSAVTLAGIGSLLAFGLSSFAWFSENEIAEATGLTISAGLNQDIHIDENISDDGIDRRITVYYYDIEQDKAVSKYNDLALTPYNVFVPTRNIYNRKFARVKLIYPGGANKGDNITVVLRTLSDFFKEDGETEAQVISNLIKFKFYDNYEGVIGKEEDGATVQDIYSQCVQVFDNIATSTKFVTINDGTPAKNKGPISVDVATPSLNRDLGEGEEYTTDFFVEIDYEEELVDYFKDHGGYDFDLNYFEVGSGITFAQDIEDIVLELKRNGNE